MTLKLIATQTRSRKAPRVKPVDHFKKCPACGCKQLIDVSPDVLCSSCDWDSIAWDVSRGGMNNPIAAAREFGFHLVAPIASPQSKPGPMPACIRQLSLNVEGA